MFILDRSRTVALLIDYDNLQICAQRDAPGSELDLRSVVGLAQRYGRLVVARAYAEWNNPTERLEAYKAGIDPIFAPVLRTERQTGQDGKSLADTVMVADGVDLLWTHGLDVLVLVTSDKDLIPLARMSKQRGARVVVLGSDLTAVPLRELADEFFTYRRLVHEMTGLVLGGPPVGRPAAGGRRPQSRSAPQEHPLPPAPVPPPPPPPPPVEERPVQPEPVPLAVAEVAQQEERPGLPAARRRRRRGGRGRNRGPQLLPVESAVGETLEVADEISANGADHPDLAAEAVEEAERAEAAEAAQEAEPAEAAEEARPADMVPWVEPAEAAAMAEEAAMVGVTREVAPAGVAADAAPAGMAELPGGTEAAEEAPMPGPAEGAGGAEMAEAAAPPSAAESLEPVSVEAMAPVAEETPGQESTRKPPTRRRRRSPKQA